uniref:Major facilitator superfamily (MFS) profile domain-containing protein n=1 Tax=Strigamia maritima TaxID=126957 RepID=T1J0H8_STRMM
MVGKLCTDFGCVEFLFFSGNFTLPPAITAEEFGLKYAGINFGLLVTYTVVGTFLNAILTQNLTSMIGWGGMFGLFAGCSGIKIRLMYTQPHKTQNVTYGMYLLITIHHTPSADKRPPRNFYMLPSLEQQGKMCKTIGVRGFVVLFGSMLLHLTFGNGYTIGNMIPYIASYLRVMGSNSNTSASDLMWIQTMGNIGQGLFINLGGIMSSYIDPRISICIGSIIASVGITISYFAVHHSLALLAFTYGLLYGIGKGIAYMAPITICMTWFPQNRALITGLIVGSLGFGGFIFSPVQTQYINPNNIAPNEHGFFTDPQLINRVPNVFFLLGAILSSIQLIGYLLLSFDSSNTKYEETSTEIVKSTTETCQSFTPKQMLCHRQFYVLWVTFFLNVQLVTFINAMCKSVRITL